VNAHHFNHAVETDQLTITLPGSGDATRATAGDAAGVLKADLTGVPLGPDRRSNAISGPNLSRSVAAGVADKAGTRFRLRRSGIRPS